MVIAHRGHREKAQENTISAFEQAILSGAKGIECDIRLTADEKPIVHHNKYIQAFDKKIIISKHTMNELQEICKTMNHDLLELGDLFDYARQNQAEFFLEVKTSSPSLIESITKELKQKNLWNQINITGWSFIVKNALLAQEKHPKLQVGQFLHLPAYSYIRKPKKSYCVFLGWLDEIWGSEKLFRMFVSPERLVRLKKFFEKNGFQVKAGVINSDSGLDLFTQAGITDIVTDRIEESVSYFKNKR
jgi:glycerophosphoryl diester phosphodiesterase